MKKLLLICFVLIINFSFAQEKSSEILSSFKNQNTNSFLSTSNNEDARLVKYHGIVSVDLKNLMIINEGKFSLKDINDKSITSLLSDLNNNYKTQFLIVENNATSIKKSSTKTSMILVTNQKFINKLITAKIIQEGLISETESYGDRDLDTFKNYAEMKDILNAKYAISSSIDLQIGNNIMPFVNKPFKTEIDKTLLNSLNLLAFNF